MSQKQQTPPEVRHVVARIQASIMAFVMAVICGLIVFIATAVLLIKDGPNVGQHLQLLGQFFPGYQVSWIGSFVGFFYGAIIGAIAGWLIGIIYNLIVDLRN